MPIFLKDVTLSNRELLNYFDLGDNHFSWILDTLLKSNIDYIEQSLEFLNENKNIKNTFLDINILQYKSLSDMDLQRINFITLSFNKNDILQLKIICEELKSFSIKIHLKPIDISDYSIDEIKKLVDIVNNLNVSGFYGIVKNNYFNSKKLKQYLNFLEQNIKNSISLAFAFDNRVGLAMSNVINVIEYFVESKREIIIDCSLNGFDQNIENINTELIAYYLKNELSINYDTLKLFDIVNNVFMNLKYRDSWAISIISVFSSIYNCHKDYIKYLVNKNNLHIESFENILNGIPNEFKKTFDKNIIENLFIKYNTKGKIVCKGTLSFTNEDKILLIGSGKNINEINMKMNEEKYIMVALNHIPNFSCDYYFFTNQKRFDEFQKYLEKEKIVITNNIDTKLNINIILPFSKFCYIDGEFVLNVALIFLNYLISIGIKKVDIIGLDGYNEFLENYNYNETSTINDKDSILKENELISKNISKLQKNIFIRLLTNSMFTNNIDFRILGVIPARYKSTRFEGKPLCLINGIPMIKRTYLKAKKSNLLDKLIVATDDIRIKDYCDSENIPVVMTSEECLTGTDRLAEVALIEDYDLYVNIQGDEPVVDSKNIDLIVEDFKKYGDEFIAYNLYKIIDEYEEITSDTIVKVIVNEKDELLYMSRYGIPFNKSTKKVNYKKQIPVYGFTKKALKIFAQGKKTINEQYEDIEILRFIDLGYRVKMRETTLDSIAVDVPSDVEKIEKFLKVKGLV